MIPQVTSLEQGIELARPVLTAIQTVRRDAALAGGYCRDIDNGVQPKDMDIYLTHGNQTFDILVAQVAAVTGHTFRLVGAAEEGNAYPDGLTVYETVTKPEDAFPINLMFTAREHHLTFDTGLCDIYWLGGERNLNRSTSYNHDREQQLITINRFRDSYQEQRDPNFSLTGNEDLAAVRRVAAHVRRIKEKYPEYGVALNANLARRRNFNEIYEVLIEEQIIGDPRTLLQAPGQNPAGDEIRQQDGAAAVPRAGQLWWGEQLTATQREAFERALVEVRANNPWGQAQLFHWDEPTIVPAPEPVEPVQLAVEAPADPVPEPAQVQPRPRGRRRR